MLTGLPPFYTKDREKLFNNIQFGEITYPEYLSPNVKNLLSGLFVKNHEIRLGSGPNGSEDIKNHPWFRDLNWDLLLKKELVPPFRPTVSNPTGNFEREFLVIPPVDSAGGEAKLASSPTYQDWSFKANNPIDDEIMRDQ